MRGHLRKRVESRRRRIHRRKHSSGKERITIRRYLKTVGRGRKSLGTVSVFGDAVRPVQLIRDIKYNSLAYRGGIHRVWGLRKFSVIRSMSSYFRYKSLTTFKNSKSSYWIWSNKLFYWKRMGRARALKVLRRVPFRHPAWLKLARDFKNSYNNRRGLFLAGSLEDASSCSAARSADSRKLVDNVLKAKTKRFAVHFDAAILGYGTVLANAGRRFGKVSGNYRSGRNRVVRNHYSRRTIKYVNSYANVVAARWSRLSTNKLSAKFRVSITLYDGNLFMAPRMFSGSTYRSITLSQFFMDNLGGTFSYIYLHRSYIDNMLNRDSSLLIKTLVMFFNNGEQAELKKLNDSVTAFKKLAVEKLKMAKKKNFPDFCYFTDAEVLWGRVQPINHVDPYDIFNVIDIAADSNAYVLAACTEVHRLVSIMVYYSLKK